MLVVVGGHSRNIGKTSLAAGLIGALPEARWTAVKITQFGHGLCSTDGKSCECSVDLAHPYALSRERGDKPRSDSARLLAAGAAHAYWIRTAAGQLGNAMPALRRILEESENTILESNSVLRFLQPDLYLVVLDFGVADLKESTRRYFDRADAYAVIDRGIERPPWPGIPARWLEAKPRFPVSPPTYLSEELVRFVASRAGYDRVNAT